MSKMNVAQPSLTKLFEKKLSATDVSRKGRLVVPKVYAEIYFPPLSQPKGKTLLIRDIKGKEWEFQYTFFLTRNCKIYALDGPSVTGFMQSRRLQAGDFVTFYHSGPEKKLVMGYYHEASSSTAIQGPLQLCSPSGRKWGRKSGAKSKPLLNDSVVDPELKINWEEAQELLRSPQSERSFIELDNEVIEEFDELPVFGKKSVFVSRETGVQEQWVQCDTCEKWRWVHVDTLLPPNWSCSDNLLDPVRSSCSASDEDSPRELIQQIQESERRKRFESSNKELNQVQEALALATTENVGIIITDREGENPVTASTKQPRHQARCSWTVCSQPLVGNGKHKVSCTCTECETRTGQCKTMKKQCRTPGMPKRQRGEAGPSQQAQSKIGDETELINPAVEPASVRGEAGKTMKEQSLRMRKRKRGDAGQTSPQAESKIRDETTIPAVEPTSVRGLAGQTSQQAQSDIRDETQLVPPVEPEAVRGEAEQRRTTRRRSVRMQNQKRGDAGQTSQQSEIRDETPLKIIPAVEPTSVRGLSGQTSQQEQSDIRDETQLLSIPAVEPAAVRNMDIDLNSAPVRNMDIDLNSAPVENINLNSAPVRNIDVNSAPVEY